MGNKQFVIVDGIEGKIYDAIVTIGDRAKPIKFIGSIIFEK